MDYQLDGAQVRALWGHGDLTMNLMRQILLWIVTLLVPVALALLAVRIVLNPWYVEFEYRTPGFPDDPYGFTRQDRLEYSRIAIDYLLNNAGIVFLGDLRFPEGQKAPDFSCQFMQDCTRLYNERELKHMLDVKMVVQAALRVLWGSLALLLLAGVAAYLAGWRYSYLHALSLGGWLTLPLIGLILLFVVAAFGLIFVFFHEIFFQSGSWTFYTSDTLIRLFPERFWRDTFLMVGGLTGVFGAVVALIARAISQRLPA
jgi:integral membrane protein (TIGR01906 family)